jgi:hypothetical protein
VFLLDQPQKLLAAGDLNPNVSVLWGTNTNDSIESPYQLLVYVNESEYIKQLNQTVHGEGGRGVDASTHRERRTRGLKDAKRLPVGELTAPSVTVACSESMPCSTGLDLLPPPASLESYLPTTNNILYIYPLDTTRPERG